MTTCHWQNFLGSDSRRNIQHSPLPPHATDATVVFSNRIRNNRIEQETFRDPVLSQLLAEITVGYVTNRSSISDFLRYKESLNSSEGIILYNNRVVVPNSLKNQILQGLHSAHQGVSSTELRTQSLAFWPGITNDIHEVRANAENAPFQGPISSEQTEPPFTPFGCLKRLDCTANTIQMSMLGPIPVQNICYKIKLGMLQRDGTSQEALLKHWTTTNASWKSMVPDRLLNVINP